MDRDRLCVPVSPRRLPGGGGAPPAVVGAGVGGVQDRVHVVHALKADTTQCPAQA